MPFLSAIRRNLGVLGWGLAFALAYAQSPLYTSNQNQYFLHGLARAGVGFLRDDWLANTADPTPVFSLLVQALAAAPWISYLIYAGLMTVYLFSLASIVGRVFGLTTAPARRLLLAGLVVLHSAALRFLLARAVAPEAEFLLEGGVAGQRLLGAVLQPSSFGVLLLLSLALFVEDRRVGAALALVAACAVHPTYLLGAGILLAGYIVAIGPRRSISMAVVGGALLAAVAIPVAFTFRPSGPDLYTMASDILIRSRIPHHAIPEKWLDWTVVTQAIAVVVCLWLVRRTRLLPVLLSGTLGVALLTTAQIASGNPTLALLFPWRLSAVLMPVSTACLLGALTALIARRWAKRPTRLRTVVILGLTAVGLASAAGVVRFVLEVKHQRDDPAAPMMDFVAANLVEGEIYFIDPKLQDFRLRTGAPVVVDAKAIPYIDREVVAWWDRLKSARNFYRSRPEWSDCAVVEQARNEYGATHVVLSPEQLGLACPGFAELFRDARYAVYRLHPLGPPPPPGGGGGPEGA